MHTMDHKRETPSPSQLGESEIRPTIRSIMQPPGTFESQLAEITISTETRPVVIPTRDTGIKQALHHCARAIPKLEKEQSELVSIMMNWRIRKL